MGVSFKDMWGTAAKEETRSFSGEELPEGTYNAEVLDCKIKPTKAGDKHMTAWDLRVVDGAYKNRRIFVNRVFSQTDESEQNQKAIKRAVDDFKLLGLPCSTDEIKDTMLNVIGKIIELKIKNGNTPGTQFQNFLRIVETPVGNGAAASSGGVIPDEELPY